jgi:hypothetical protein
MLSQRNQYPATNGRRCNYQDLTICTIQSENISVIFRQHLPLSLVHTTSINSRVITVNRFYLSFASPYLHWRIVVHTMEHSPSSEAERRSENQIFLCLLQNRNFHRSVRKRSLLDSIPSEINAVHAVITLLGKAQ